MVKQIKPACRTVYLAGKVGYAIGDHQVSDPVAEVVVYYLVKYLLGYLHLRSLAFNNHHRLARAVMHQNIGPAEHGVKPESNLDAYQSRRIVKMLYQVVDEMLSHPLLGSKGYIFLPQGVINGFFSRTLFYPY